VLIKTWGVFVVCTILCSETKQGIEGKLLGSDREGLGTGLEIGLGIADLNLTPCLLFWATVSAYKPGSSFLSVLTIQLSCSMYVI